MGNIVKNVLEGLLQVPERRIKKYALDAEGKLKVYQPEVQQALLTVLRKDGDLDALLKAREDEDKAEAKGK